MSIPKLWHLHFTCTDIGGEHTASWYADSENGAIQAVKDQLHSAGHTGVTITRCEEIAYDRHAPVIYINAPVVR